MNKKTPNIKVNSILNVTRTIMTIIFPLITYPYVTRLFQHNGAAITTFFSEFVVLLIGMIASRKLIKIENCVNVIVTVCASCLLMVLVSWGLDQLISNLYVSLVVKMVSCIVVYFLGLLLMGNTVVVKTFKQIIGKFKKGKHNEKD